MDNRHFFLPHGKNSLIQNVPFKKKKRSNSTSTPPPSLLPLRRRPPFRRRRSSVVFFLVAAAPLAGLGWRRRGAESGGLWFCGWASAFWSGNVRMGCGKNGGLVWDCSIFWVDGAFLKGSQSCMSGYLFFFLSVLSRYSGHCSCAYSSFFFRIDVIFLVNVCSFFLLFRF